MEFQVNINYSFIANSEAEAKEKAQQYVSTNLQVKALRDSVYSPASIASKCESFRTAKREHFYVFLLDTQNRIIERETVSIGTLNASLIHPRECFRTAIVKSAASVIFVHNHPSGGLEPSTEDIHVTKRLVDAGKLLGIAVLDHVIVTVDSYTSFRERNIL